MTLRLRLTLFYTLLVAIVLAVSGLGLHLLLRRNLYQSLDHSLREAANLLGSLTIDSEETPKLHDEENTLQLAADLSALLFDEHGKLLDSLGRVPEPLPGLSLGFSMWGEWRSYAETVQGGTLVLLRDRERVEESLRQFDSSFFILTPMAVLLAFILGYLLAGQALNPVTSLTKAAYDLAQRRAWREALPEPKQRDELWQLARGTNTLLSALASVIESEKRFTADAAHELRTPLTVLQGRLEQALECNQDKDLAPLLGKSATALEELLMLVEKLLLLARTEAEQGLSKEVVDITEIAATMSEMQHSQFEQKGLLLKLELPGSPVLVKGDHLALGLVVRNLLENAYKFTDHGEVKLIVLQENQNVVLTIKDIGVGISEEALPHLFERFYQGNVQYRRQGSGLGLSLVQSIVKWHGGTIEAQNSLAGGAVFTVKLPLAEDKE